MLALQARPSTGLELGMVGFYSKMNAANYGRLQSSALNSMLRGLGGAQGGAAVTSSNGQRVYAQIKNPVIVEQTTIYGHTLKVLQGADIVYAPGTTPQYIGDTEHANRRGASASSGFLDFDFKYKASEDLKIKGLLSTTRGEGTTEADRVISWARFGTGVKYKYNGLGEAPDFAVLGAGPNVPVRNADGSGYSIFSANGANRHHTVDREGSLALDAEYTQDSGIFSSLEFGARHANHHRDYRRRIKANKTLAVPAFDASQAVAYPGDFGSSLGGSGNWDRSGFYFPNRGRRQLLRDPAQQGDHGRVGALRQRRNRAAGEAGRALPDAEPGRQQVVGQYRLPPGAHQGRRDDRHADPGRRLRAHRAGQAGGALCRVPRRHHHRRQRAVLLRRRGLEPGRPDLVQAGARSASSTTCCRA